MSWRVVVISERCKLDLSMGYMVVRGEETQRMFIDEIDVLIIENNAVSITGCLLNELAHRKTKVIFCDNKRNPSFEITPLYGSHDCSKRIREQILWSNDIKGEVWTSIVIDKIRKQAEHLFFVGNNDEGELLQKYTKEVKLRDESNREGHAAKVYFNALFGKRFSRKADNVINAALDYGYSLILSAFNREIVANGYVTQLGLAHENMFNEFNLSCDLMEPFRILVDRKVVMSDYEQFEKDEKRDMVSLLNEQVRISSAKQTVINAIRLYCHSVFNALNSNDISQIDYYEVL